jgi:AcrR family transcriptional regulator
MGRRSDHSRAELEALILAAGKAQLAETGFAGFSAREVAKRIGYSVGTIYHLFGSYDRLILAINAGTLRAWSAFLEERLQAADGDRIAALVFAYFDFAAANRNLWMALYDHRMSAGEPLTEEFVESFSAVASVVEREVAAALGKDDAADVSALAASLIATAHGHCTFALNGTFELFGAWDPRQAALDRIRAVLHERQTH